MFFQHNPQFHHSVRLGAAAILEFADVRFHEASLEVATMRIATLPISADLCLDDLANFLRGHDISDR